MYTRKSHNSNRVPRKVPLKFNSDKKGRIFSRWTEQPRFLEKVIRSLGQDQWGWHNLRHRFASRLSKDNVPIFEIISLLGHSNIETTQQYLQLLP